MKKVLLVTLQGDNLGNRLQNYALQVCLEQLGCEVWTPVYYPRELDRLNKRIKNWVKVFLGRIGFKKYFKDKNAHARKKKFDKFNKKYISNCFRTDFKTPFKNKWDSFDYAITGSDQVWHKWTDKKNELPFFYLEFIERNKRISYAASFGFNAFPKEDKKQHKCGLEGIKYLACREKRGAELIYELTGRVATVVVDPTLLLEPEKWDLIKKKSPLFTGNPYLLIYFLGAITDEYKNVIECIAKDNNLDIIDILNRESLQSLLTTPDEFLWLVKHATYICTDSFHASVFSIIFEKKFMVFKRIEAGMETMFDRIETLLEMFGVSDRVYDGNIGCLYEKYSAKDIRQIKEKSLNYIIEILKEQQE